MTALEIKVETQRERHAYLEEKYRDVDSGQQRTEGSITNAELFQVPVCTSIKMCSG